MASTEFEQRLHLEPWLTTDEYNLAKKNFQEENIGSVLLYMEEDLEGELSDLNETEFNKAAELISIFQFGAYMMFKRVGHGDRDISVGIDVSENTDYGFAAYQPEIQIFLIKKSSLVEFVKDYIKDETSHYDWSGMEDMRTEEIFEASGVEEAAHLIFHNKKGDLGRYMYEGNISDEEYFSSEIEYRAFLWKSAYVKRYMPQYHDSIQNSIQRIEQYIHERDNKL
jgi:hypothetical protein